MTDVEHMGLLTALATTPLIGRRRDDSEQEENHPPHPHRPERLMEATLDALDTHIAIVNEAGEIIEVNESWRRFARANTMNDAMHGVGVNYLLLCDQVTGESEREAREVAAGLRSVLAGERAAFSMQYACHSPTTQRWFDVRITRFQSQGNTYAVVAHENVTQRILADRALRDSEERYRLIAAATEEVIWDWNMETSTVRWGGAIKSRFGFDLDGVETDIDWWADRIHPDDAPWVFAQLERFFADGEFWSAQYRFRKADEQYAPVLDRGSVVRDQNGKPTRMIGSIADLTAHKQAEEALQANRERTRLIVDTAMDAVVITDHDGRIEGWNAQAEQTFGHTQHDAVGRHMAELILTDTSIATRLFPVIAPPNDAGEQRHVRLETTARHRDDRTFPVEMSITAVNTGGRAIYSVFIRDITARRTAETELRTAMLQAEAANRAKSEFLANMSHEIRTPMTAILGYTSLLIDESPTLPAEARQSLDTIKRNAEHLLAILNDILDLSKIEAGKVEIEPTACSPRRIVQEVATMLGGRAREKGIEFRVDCIEPLPPRIRVDVLRVRQILLNLASNAIKFTDAGLVQIIVRVDEQSHQVNETPQPHLIIEVVDTGIGIPVEHQAKLFAPFTQADSSTTRKFGGTGLGLIISQRLARMMNGHISFESVEGRGSTFRLAIPVETPAAREKQPPFDERGMTTVQNDSDAAAEDAELHARPLNHRRVLLAEDGPDNQRLLSHLLRHAGAQVEIADNGRTAVEVVTAAESRGEPFDLVLLDMQMPQMDGYATAAELRRRGFTVPIIAITAHAMPGDRERCLDAGCDDYTPKPVDRETLIRLASIQITRHSARTAIKDFTAA